MRRPASLILLATALAATEPTLAHGGNDKRWHSHHHHFGHARVLKVNCTKGGTIARALERARPGDTIRIHGVCKERIRITQGPLTIEGRGHAALDGSNVHPDDNEMNALIMVDGASGVRIRDLMLMNNVAEGIYAHNGAGVHLDGLNIVDNRRGVLLSGASAEIGDVSISGGGTSLQATTGSSVVFLGRFEASGSRFEGLSLLASTGELRGGHILCHSHRGFSLAIVGNSVFNVLGFDTSLPGRLEVFDNRGPGILLAGGSLGIGVGPILPTSPLVLVTDNDEEGVRISSGGVLANAAGWATIRITKNKVGVSAGPGSVISTEGGLEIRDNTEAGMLASDASVLIGPGINPVVIQDNGSGRDVVLEFGTRATIRDPVTIGSPLNCDSTVLSTGDELC